MSSVDVIVGIFLGAGLLRGAWQGAGRQLAQLISWVVSLAAAWYLAAPAGRVLVRLFEMPYSLAFPLAGLLLAVVAYIVVRLALWWPLRQVEGDDDDRPTALSVANRVIGGLLGFARMSVLVWAALSLVMLARTPLEKIGHPLPVAHSSALKVAQRHNAWTMLYQKRLTRLGEASASLKAPGGGKPLDEVAGDPRLLALTNDPRLREAMEAGEFTVLLQDERVLSLVSDDALIEKVRVALTGAGP